MPVFGSLSERKSKLEHGPLKKKEMKALQISSLTYWASAARTKPSIVRMMDWNLSFSTSLALFLASFDGLSLLGIYCGILCKYQKTLLGQSK